MIKGSAFTRLRNIIYFPSPLKHSIFEKEDNVRAYSPLLQQQMCLINKSTYPRNKKKNATLILPEDIGSRQRRNSFQEETRNCSSFSLQENEKRPSLFIVHILPLREPNNFSLPAHPSVRPLQIKQQYSQLPPRFYNGIPHLIEHHSGFGDVKQSNCKKMPQLLVMFVSKDKHICCCCCCCCCFCCCRCCSRCCFYLTFCIYPLNKKPL